MPHKPPETWLDAETHLQGSPSGKFTTATHTKYFGEGRGGEGLQ